MPSSADDLSEEQATRLVIRALAAAIAFLLASSTGLGLTRSSVGDSFQREATVVDAIGPLSGTDIGRYAEARRSVLAELRGEAVAVVSLAAYSTEGSARGLAKSAKVETLALLVAAPDGQPQAVTGGIESWLRDERRRAEIERDELASLLKTTTDPDFTAQFEFDIARLERLVARLSSVRELAFGVVVKGGADQLRALAQREDVRLVDPGSGTRRPPLDSLRGLRPEERTRTGEPQTRPSGDTGSSPAERPAQAPDSSTTSTSRSTKPKPPATTTTAESTTSTSEATTTTSKPTTTTTRPPTTTTSTTRPPSTTTTTRGPIPVG